VRTWSIEITDERWLRARVAISARGGPHPIELLVAVRLEEESPDEYPTPPDVAAAELAMGHADAERVAAALEGDVAVQLRAQDKDGEARALSVGRGRLSVETPHPDVPTLDVAFGGDEARRVADALRAASAHRKYLDSADLSWDEEVDELLADFGARPPAPAQEIRRIQERWPRVPDDYLRVLRRKNGGEGALGETWLVLHPVEELHEVNEDLAEYEHLRDVVVVGSNGAGEIYGFDLRDRAWVMAPLLGERTDFIVLGETFLDALRKADSGPFD
jgi:SMI1/KNR4 family protein SUKH-1